LDKNIAFFKNQKNIDHHISILEHILANINQSKNTYVELLNEPQCENVELLNQFYKHAINRIREKGYKNNLVIESNLAGAADTFYHLEEFFDYDDITFSFHFYGPIKFTHRKAYWTDEGSENILYFPYMDNDTTFNELFLLEKLKPVIDFAGKTDEHVFCGEFGVCAGSAARFKIEVD
jgi:hypothetical protein